MKTIQDIDLQDKTVLVRVDYNVPLATDEHTGKPTVASDFRIRASLPTLEYLRSHGAKKIVLLSHLGRPTGPDANLSLAPVAEALKSLTGNVFFIPEISGPAVASAVQALPDGGILLLENLRFYPGEKANDPAFIEPIIDSIQPSLYVQDGFAALHRAHASTSAVQQFLPVYAGLLVAREVENLSRVLNSPAHPMTLIIGGAKVEDKSPLIDKFLPLADHILVGGKIAADGFSHPSDKIYVAEDFDTDSTGAKLDIGPLATAKFADAIVDSKTIIWNGLLGYAEDPAYATASTIVAELLGEKDDATVIICGGDTTGFIEELVREHPNLHYSLISTGGGAALGYLLGKPLPGLTSL